MGAHSLRPGPPGPPLTRPGDTLPSKKNSIVVVGAALAAIVLASALVLLDRSSRHHVPPHQASPATSSTLAPSPPGAPATAPSRPIPAPQAAPPAGSYNVVSYGADPTGHHDSTQAIRSAVSAADKAPGNTVYFPAGRYLLDLNDGAKQDIDISANPVNIVGAGPASATIVEEIGAKTAGVTTSKTIFQIETGANGQPGGGDGTTITGLTLDSATYDAGTTIIDYGNDTTLSHLTIMGARSDKQYNRDVFGVRVIAVCNHTDLSTRHRSDNIVDDLTITGQGSAGNTDLDISCQYNAFVSDVGDTGNGMDIYICDNVVLSGYTFMPGAVEASPKSYVITGPSQNLTIRDITTYGSGGQLQPSPNGYSITNTTITNETMKDPTMVLEIGDADQTTIANSTIGILKLNPDNSVAGLTVVNSSVASVICGKKGDITGLTGLAC